MFGFLSLLNLLSSGLSARQHTVINIFSRCMNSFETSPWQELKPWGKQFSSWQVAPEYSLSELQTSSHIGPPCLSFLLTHQRRTLSILTLRWRPTAMWWRCSLFIQTLITQWLGSDSRLAGSRRVLPPACAFLHLFTSSHHSHPWLYIRFLSL